MKRLLIVFFVLAHLVSLSQAKISMMPNHVIFPNDTVNYGDSVHLTVFVKNIGNATYSGFISVQAKRDTTFGGSCGSSTLSPAGLPPNDSIQTDLVFTPSFAGNFKVGGNGNTIVVWPYITPGSGDIGDSLRLVLWINDPNSVRETKRNKFLIYPNPVSEVMTIESMIPSGSKIIVIYDVFARKVMELAFRENVNLSELIPGAYWMLIRSDDDAYRIPFIKE